MGPKRGGGKTKAESNGDSAGPSKKARMSKVEYRWEYEGDKRTWTQYSDALNKVITDAFEGKKAQVEFDLDNGVKMAVNFDKMVQKNKKTGWERPIRIAVKDEKDKKFYTWQWEDEKGNYNPYSSTASLGLEEAWSNKESTYDLEASHRSYRIDIAKLEQTNTTTDVTRKVSRAESTAIKADPGAPAPVASSTSATPDKAAKSGRAAIKADPGAPAPVATSTSASPDKAAKSEWAAIKADPGAPAPVATSTSATPDKAAKSGRGKGKSKMKKEEPMEEEEEEEEKPATKSGAKAKSGAKPRPAVKTVVMSGKAPVDPDCPLVGKAHVYYEGSDVYDCMLNQTNVSNNNNKYFVIQLLEDDNKKLYHAWFRWGRVGYKGQSSLYPCGGSLEAAKKQFMKKFSDKTKNDWANRKKFVKVSGKYDLLQMDYSAKDTDEVDAPVKKREREDVKVPDSKLDKRLQTLVDLICDVKQMEEAVVEMQYDCKKAPLGKLTTDQIKAGYAALKKIDACIEKGDLGSNLTQACDDFYTRIPHDFGMRPPAKITTKAAVKAKIELLEALGDIEIAIKMLKEGDRTENPIDRHYHSLKCDLQPMDHKSDEFKMIDKYLQNTHAATHNQYKMKILDVFDMAKHGEDSKFVDHGNRMLLWHGSRLTNWVGILSQGLRIAPPEAPVTGYMFGKGVYFADMSSKSANYCFASKAKKTGLLLLCDVALGKCNELLSADYAADKLPPGKQSVKGAGAIAPDPSDVHKTKDGVLVPWGKGKNTGTTNPKGYTLNYNEFIVYNTNQIRMKYLLKIEFNFK